MKLFLPQISRALPIMGSIAFPIWHQKFGIPNEIITENIIHNFSSYVLTAVEKYALSFGLDHHIPSKPNINMIKTEFEAFYYHINKHLSHLSTRRNQGCFRRFANSRISKTSLVWKVISFQIFAQTRLLNAPWVENLSYSQIQTSFRGF